MEHFTPPPHLEIFSFVLGDKSPRTSGISVHLATSDTSGFCSDLSFQGCFCSELSWTETASPKGQRQVSSSWSKDPQTGLLADPLGKIWFSRAWGFSALHNVAPSGVQLCVVPAVAGVWGKRNQCKHKAPAACCAACE